MRILIKIIITDSAGEEHIFNEAPGDVENYLDLRPRDSDDEPLVGAVRVTTLVFPPGREKADLETVSTFISPRRADAIFGREP